MVTRVLNIPVHTVLDSEHSLNVEITSSGNQISLVSVDSAEGIRDQMAPVVEIQAVNEIIFYSVPPGRSDHSDRFALLGGQNRRTDTAYRTPRAAELIQLAELVKFFCANLLLRKIRNVIIDRNDLVPFIYRYCKSVFGQSASYCAPTVRCLQVI